MPEVDFDLSAIEAEVGKMSQEDLIAELVKTRARQRAATKKYYNPETAKRARVKRSAKLKAMAQVAEQLGLTEQINALVDEAVAEADDNGSES